MTTSESFVCPQCGKTHEGLPTDWGFKKPDEIHALTYLEQYQSVRINDDLATLKESRHFLRGVLELTFTHQDGYFGWGIWVEVSKKHHDLYVKNFYNEASNVPRFKGSIANELSGYSSTVGLEVEVQLGNTKQRPTFFLLAKSSHLLAQDQRQGIGSSRHHQLLEACGHFNE